MASPAAPSTKETTNFARLCRLLVDVGTQALRDNFDALHPPATLYTVLARNKATLLTLKTKKKIINPTQWGKLFPAIPSSVSSASFDITLLMVLMRNICGLAPPATGWDVLPAATDLSRAADIARVKYFRNTVFSHAEHASVDDATFKSHWQNIRDTLVRLGGVEYKAAIDLLETDCMDPEAEKHYIELLAQWKKDEENVKEKLDEIESGMGKVIKKLDALEAASVALKREITAEVKIVNSKEATRGSIKCKEKYHENEPVEYFCEDCRVCICHKCGQTSHNHHNKKDLQQAAEERKNKMMKRFDRVKAKAIDVEAKMKKQTEMLKKSEDEIFSAEKEMIETVEEKMQLLNEHKITMKAKLSKIREAQRGEHETRMKKSETVASQLRASFQNGEGMLRGITGPEILEGDCAAVFTRCEELLNEEEIEVFKPRYVTYRVNKNIAINSVLGEIFVSQSPVAKGKLKEAEYKIIHGVPVQDSLGKRLWFKGYGLVGSFLFPRGIAVSERTGNIAIAEANRVQLFDSDWNHLNTIGGKKTGAEIIDQPTSVAFTASGNIIVIHKDGLKQKMSVFTKGGYFITDIKEHVISPLSVSVGTAGHLVVCDMSGKTVKLLSPDGTNLIQTIRASCCDDFPGFAVHHQGMFVVPYDSAHCVKVFSQDGQMLYEIGCKGTGEGQLRRPEGLAIDRFGNLVICDHDNKRLQIFSWEGKFMRSVNKQIKNPCSVAVAKNGDLLVCEQGTNGIRILEHY